LNLDIICLKDERENYVVHSVQYCVQQLLYTVQCTHQTDLTVVCWLYIAFCGYDVCYSLSVLDLTFGDYFVL